MLSWSTSIQPQRVTLFGEATLPICGYAANLADRESHRGRWRD